jgi:hypothetical protein
VDFWKDSSSIQWSGSATGVSDPHEVGEPHRAREPVAVAELRADAPAARGQAEPDEATGRLELLGGAGRSAHGVAHRGWDFRRAVAPLARRHRRRTSFDSGDPADDPVIAVRVAASSPREVSGSAERSAEGSGDACTARSIAPRLVTRLCLFCLPSRFSGSNVRERGYGRVELTEGIAEATTTVLAREVRQ